MKLFEAKLESLPGSPLSMGKYYAVPKLNDGKETHHEYEERTWRERLHYDEANEVFITQMMLKNCLAAAAKYRSEKIPGKGKQTYTKHFEAGILIDSPMYLGLKKDEVKGVKILVPSDGKRGGTKRVEKTFPTIPKWNATARIYILDETITKEVLEEHLQDAGMYIGLGTFRPRNNGINGRFKLLSLKEIKM